MDKSKDATELWARHELAVWLLAVTFALLLSFLVGNASGVVLAQAETQAETQADTQAVTPDEVNQVARQLWCPLCSGVRLDACELKACDQMKDVIAIKLAEGEDSESIQAYFVEQYGPQVMGEPPRSGFNWLAWILPAVAAVVGAFVFWRTTQRMMQPAMPLEAGADFEPVARTTTPNSVALKPDGENEDEYTQKLEEELAKYG